MRNKKIGTWIARLLITMLTFMGLGQTMVHAVEENGTTGHTTDVIITKLQSAEGAHDRPLGEGQDYDQPIGALPAETLNGVSFTWYKVSEELFNIMKASPGDYETKEDIPAEIIGTETDETSGSGQVTVSGLDEGFYWFIENTKGTIVSSTAVPFGLALPFTNRAGTGYLDKLYVYPKNVLTDDQPEIEKEVNESNVAIGDLNTWTVSIKIPVGIEDYDLFSFYDMIDSRLDYVGIESVMAAGITLDITDDYTVDFTDPKLEVKFTEAGRMKLKDADPKKVDIKIQTRVNETAIMGQEIRNSATLEFDNSHGTTGEKTPTDIPSVHTGGKAFKKMDGSSEALLEGAEFKIKNNIAEHPGYGKFVNVGTNGVITFGTEAEATVFKSNVNGEFEVKGLPYGDYVLVETKAPKGYALPTDPNTPFKVNAKSYYTYPTLVKVGEYNKPADVFQTINNRALVIPQTGGIGTALFTVIGAMMMLFSAFFYKRTKEA